MDPENAFCPSILSHNASTHNVLLKVTVPRRTGRKRKRGTGGPWEGEASASGTAAPQESGLRDQVASQKRADHPKTVLRKLQDNPESYQVETVGVIKHTHRYRGRFSPYTLSFSLPYSLSITIIRCPRSNLYTRQVLWTSKLISAGPNSPPTLSTRFFLEMV